jgi:Na+/melibiose symporter-like transporter
MVSSPLSVQKSGGGPMDSPKAYSSKQARGDGVQFLSGLILAGVASTILTTIFGIFHVDVFLQVYKLPLSTYATGNFIFSFINTANDVAGAWIVDVFASESSRSSIIGISGCLFSFFFLSPFFQWNIFAGFSPGFHFVTSMSLYDTMYSFMAILMGSVITDNHKMSNDHRIRFMAASKVVNLLASLIVARLGLTFFSKQDLQPFQNFVIVIAILVCVLFTMAQWMMKEPGVVTKNDDVTGKPTKRKLRFKQVVLDFLAHDNFRAWIGMEMLLECQHNFVSSFLKTFVDRLVVDAGVSRQACDWLLSLLHPMKHIAGIMIYVPIRRMGYRRIYTYMFWANLILSATCLAIASPQSPYLIIAFLLIHTIMTGAVQSAGFHLAMSDMVLEMKRNHAVEGRLDEPSLAGLFMGANALLCKPMESVLPIVAAYFLGNTDFSTNEQSETAKTVLFYLLVVPPLVFSCLQLMSWRKYNLHTQRMDSMREELEELTAMDSREAADLVA